MFRYAVILLITFAFISFFFLVVFKGKHIWLINRGRRKGFNPRGKPTMFHVRDLLVRGEKELAIQMYCQIYQVSRKRAKEAVEELDRSIQEKNIELE